MAISILNHDKVDAAGINLNSGGYSVPRDCFDVSYVGCVIDMTERNGYDDSDFYAQVWDEAEGCVKSIMYATTRGWTYCNNADIDATPEVLAKVNAWYRANLLKREENKLRAKFAAVHVGALVRVVRGRKVPKGFEGRVIAVGRNSNPYAPTPRFRSGAWDTSFLEVTISNDTSTRTVKAEYLEVIPEPERTEAAIAEGMAYARTWIANHETNGRSMAYNTGAVV